MKESDFLHIETNSLKLKVDSEFFWIGIVKNGVNFEHISHLVLVFLLLTLRR